MMYIYIYVYIGAHKGPARKGPGGAHKGHQVPQGPAHEGPADRGIVAGSQGQIQSQNTSRSP